MPHPLSKKNQPWQITFSNHTDVLAIAPIFILTCLFSFMMSAAGHAQMSIDSRLTPELQAHQAIVLLVDPEDGSIIDANRAASQFYGYSTEQLRSMTIQEINALEPSEVQAEFRRARGEERSYFIFPHRLASGEIRTVEVYSSPFEPPSGKEMLLSIIHDATDKILMEEELQRYQNRLEELVAQKTEEALQASNRAKWITVLGTIIVFALGSLLLQRQQKFRFLSRQLALEQEKKLLLERFEYLNRYANDIILLVDVQGRIVEANERAVTMHGFPRDELLQKNIRELTEPEYSVSFEHIQKKADQEKGYIYEGVHVRRDGTSFPVESSVKNIRIGKHDFFQYIIRDITDRKRAEDKIMVMNEQLQKVNAEKDKLLSIIAHDLKSPLAGVYSTSEALAKDAAFLSQEEISLVSAEMHKSSKNALALLNDLMQWARMSQGGMDFSPEKCSLSELVRSSLYTARDVAQKKDIAISCDIPKDLAVMVDQSMINTVIRNVIFNAVKFTRPGGNISLTASQTGPDVQVCISDNGIGMSESILSAAFSVDKNKRQLGTDGEKGTGLGLVLCKEFVEKHGGRIWLESEPGKGTKVFFTLPGV